MTGLTITYDLNYLAAETEEPVGLALLAWAED